MPRYANRLLTLPEYALGKFPEKKRAPEPGYLAYVGGTQLAMGEPYRTTRRLQLRRSNISGIS